MIALSFRLATLTIVEGDYYRDVSDNKRVKEVYTTAPRGEIRDRNGKLLAGNLPSFTVQILKDELNIKDKTKKNNALLSLVRLLEEDGVDYLSDYPISLNEFRYKTEEDYFEEELSPLDKVVDLIIKEDLLGEILKGQIEYANYKEHFKYDIRDKVQKLIEKDKDLNLLYEDIENLDQEIVNLVGKDKTTIRKIVDHPISRLIVYNTLNDLDLLGNITMEEYSITFDEEYKTQKRFLMGTYDNIDFTTSAKSDFINIFKEESLINFLETLVIKENDKGKEETIAPAQILLDMVRSKGEVPVDIELNRDENYVIIKYIGSREDLLKSPGEVLVDYAIHYRVLEDFITSDSIKYLAQDQLLKDGVNARISVANDFEYAFINNKNRWLNENKIKEDLTVLQIFEHIKKRYFIK